MSHVVNISTLLYSLEAIRLACKELGFSWRENQSTFKFWGSHVGNYPLPTGFKVSDMGKCEHAIGIPGTTWEVGVVRRRKADGSPDEGWTLLFDFFGSQGRPILAALGCESKPDRSVTEPHKFVKEYAAQQSVLLAQKRGHTAQVLRTEQEVKRYNELHRVNIKYQPGKVYVGIVGRSL